MEKKYGLQLRVPPSQQKKQHVRPPLPKPAGFADEDDDDVEKEISRHATQKKTLREIEQQHKKALEEDPSIFDYDGAYDEMKEKVVRPRAQDRQERKPKYIQALMDKAKQREREQEVVYERKLAKERNKDDHLFADKDKFITSAYKKKLAEQAKWLQEEKLRELREEKDDVTKKSDLTDFYFSIGKNVAFGSRESAMKEAELSKPDKEKPPAVDRSEAGPSSNDPPGRDARSPARVDEKHSDEVSPRVIPKPQDPIPKQLDEKPGSEQPKPDHHKRTQDAVAAAKERFMARKKAKVL
ncbi:hypothetical protein V2J09_017046 [Rumex salicifolius]